MATIPGSYKRKRQNGDEVANANLQDRPRGKKLKIGSAAQQPSTMSLNPLKSRLRSLTRSLASGHAEKLPANVRVTQERELAALRSEIQRLEGQKLRKKMIEKYHMVRFFERRKAERSLKKAERKLKELLRSDAPEPERKVVEEQIWRCQVDVNYAIFSPLAWKYCSLYPPKSGDGDLEDSGEVPVETQTKGDLQMWKRVEEATRSGARALGKLREELPAPDTVDSPANVEVSQDDRDDPGTGRRKKPGSEKATFMSQQIKEKQGANHRQTKTPKSGSSKRERIIAKEDKGDDDDDGGFFE